jgi:hypothetical protein
MQYGAVTTNKMKRKAAVFEEVSQIRIGGPAPIEWCPLHADDPAGAVSGVRSPNSIHDCCPRPFATNCGWLEPARTQTVSFGSKITSTTSEFLEQIERGTFHMAGARAAEPRLYPMGAE